MQGDRLGEIDPLNDRMSEDCLYLNVWTPARKGQQRLPVMVWLHGGGHVAGAGSEPWYQGTHLAQQGVVVVTLNYRLDVFGFLAHPHARGTEDCSAAGNYGLLDQIAALQWVRRNIAAFGGDPGTVTVFGESAGSVSIGALMASPLARGLFHRAIAQSGSPMMPPVSPYAFLTAEAAAQEAIALGRALGAHSLEALRAVPADRVLQAALDSAQPVGRFGVTTGNCVLPLAAETVFAQGRQYDVPLLAGWTADEGTLFNLRRRASSQPPDFREEVHAQYGERADAVLELYPTHDAPQAQASSDALLGDILVAYPMWRWIELQSQTGRAPVYRYLFDLRPPAPQISRTPLAAPGVFHSADIVYAFDNLQVRDWPWRPEDRELARIVSTYWVNFARTGDPNRGDSGAARGTREALPAWPTYRPGGYGPVMYLGRDSHAAPERHRDRYELLLGLYGSDDEAPGH